MPKVDDLTPGQKKWIEDKKDSSTNVVLTEATRTSVELVPFEEDELRPWRARFTLTDKLGQTAQIDEWPPLGEDDEEGVSAPSPTQQEYIDTALASEVTTDVVVEGVLGDYEIVEHPEEKHEAVVQWNVATDDGRVATLIEAPERSEEEKQVIEESVNEANAASAQEAAEAIEQERASDETERLKQNPLVITLLRRVDALEAEVKALKAR